MIINKTKLRTQRNFIFNGMLCALFNMIPNFFWKICNWTFVLTYWFTSFYMCFKDAHHKIRSRSLMCQWLKPTTDCKLNTTPDTLTLVELLNVKIRLLESFATKALPFESTWQQGISIECSHCTDFTTTLLEKLNIVIKHPVHGSL